MRIGLVIIFGVIVGVLSWLWFRDQQQKRDTAERLAALARAEGFQVQVGGPRCLFSELRGVRIVEISGGADFLQITQVVVELMDGTNVARLRPGENTATAVEHSGIYENNPTANGPLNPINGNTEQSVMYHSSGGNAFWRRVFDKDYDISKITIYNRKDCCQARLGTYTLRLLNASRQLLGLYKLSSDMVQEITPTMLSVTDPNLIKCITTPPPPSVVSNPVPTFKTFVEDLNSDDPVVKQSAETILSGVSEPSESGDDAFQIKFPKYVSIYAWSRYGNSVISGRASSPSTPTIGSTTTPTSTTTATTATTTSSATSRSITNDYTSDAAFKAAVAARNDLLSNYDSIQKAMIDTVYDRNKLSAWAADPRAQSCISLDILRTNFLEERASLRRNLQDLSGTAIVAGALRDENMEFQKQYIDICEKEPMSQACKDLASQEARIFPLLSQYEGVNTELLTKEVDIVETIKVISDTYDLLQCTNPKLSFDSDRDIGLVDTEALKAKLETLSPYYLSPDTLKYITSFLLSAEVVDETVSSASDRFLLMNKNLGALRQITGGGGV